ncbi:MAG: Uncharacterized protein G01um10145_893 [Microgenomates group bacterium Gr01-1014_5]|nr:MAG: Uncharacterized protein G01um10145_893 [Microgenomates group bacterium Gr01-1014_5]
MFVPGGFFIEFAREVLRDNYKFFANVPNDVLIAQTVILDLLAVILTGVIVFFIALFLKKETVVNKKSVLFWLLFTFLSFTPYVVLSKDFAYLESRYYYLPVAGGAVLLSWIAKRIWDTLGKKLFLIIIFPFFLGLIVWHAISVGKAIDEQLIFSNWRKNFILDLKTLAPSLSCSKNVFYISGEKNYWSDGNIVPFQQGTGYTLMVLYNDSGRIPKELLAESYLFEIGSQGYKEVGEKGFGFFTNKEELDKVVETHKLQQDCIIALSYDSQRHKLIKND